MLVFNIVSYAVKIIVSTFIIWASIEVVDRDNYRNNLKNALIAAVILSFAGAMPLLFFFGLLVWVVVLINYYSVGFFKSFLCVIVYGVIFFLLNLLLIALLIGSSVAYTKVVYMKKTFTRRWEQVVDKASSFFNFPQPVLDKLGVRGEVKINGKMIAFKKDIRIYLKNGRILDARIIMEGQKGLLIDIAEGKSEIVIRKDSVDHIEEIY